MFDYRNNIKKILNNTSADDKSLQNSLNAIKAIINMTGDEIKNAPRELNPKSIDSKQVRNLLSALTELITKPGDSNA